MEDLAKMEEEARRTATYKLAGASRVQCLFRVICLGSWDNYGDFLESSIISRDVNKLE